MKYACIYPAKSDFPVASVKCGLMAAGFTLRTKQQQKHNYKEDCLYVTGALWDNKARKRAVDRHTGETLVIRGGIPGYYYIPTPVRTGYRFKIPLDGWKGGEYTLIIGQRTFTDWDDVIKGIKGKVVFRPHPGSKKPPIPKGVEVSKNTLEEDLKGAESVIVHSSSVATIALMCGIPVWALGDVMVSDMCNQARPDREEGFRKLSWQNWSLDEIERGIPFAFYR